MGVKGNVSHMEIEGAMIHTYTSPLEGFLVNSHIVETEEALVLIDAQFSREYASELLKHVENLDKALDRVIVSHAHPDHWFGLEVIADRFPDVPIFALEEVREYARENGQAELDAQRELFDDAIADSVVVPTETLIEGAKTIDGLRYQFEKYYDAEADVNWRYRFPDRTSSVLSISSFRTTCTCSWSVLRSTPGSTCSNGYRNERGTIVS